MGFISFNGKTFVGSSVTITNGKVIIDGVDQTPDAKQINISIEGDIQSLNADACGRIEVTGNVGSLETMSGDVSCGNVTGSVTSTSGNISAADVGGSVETMSGNVTCGDVGGDVETLSGNIKRK